MMVTMKKMIIFAYQDMDSDLPQTPEDTKELRKYKLEDDFRIRKVSSESLFEWISVWPGQATYVCQQLWFTQKI